MPELNITIDGKAVTCKEGVTVLEAADAADVYVPRLCHHPDLPCTRDTVLASSVHQGPVELTGEGGGEKAGEKAHCNLCLVQIDGAAEPVNACSTVVSSGMLVSTVTENITRLRRAGLAKILADHPHACLTCAQKQGCSRVDCSSNVPVEERCCKLLGSCELEKVADFIGIPGETPKYVPAHRPVDKGGPLIERDFNLCIGCLRCVRVCNDVRKAEVLGATWKDDRAWIGTLTGDGLKEAECRFCGACVEVCPTGALMDAEGEKKAGQTAPCSAACPLGIDIPRYVRLIALGEYRQALELIRTRTPFPTILGYVCFHPCEESCRRGRLDEPVSICALKRFVAEANPQSPELPKKPATGKKVAIVGAGPAGLTAAYFLATVGHEVTLFDGGERPGGMLRHAIPDYRLPPEVLEREMRFLEQLGVTFEGNALLGRDLSIDELKARGYDAVLVAVGTSLSKRLPVDGVDLENVYPGLEFLRSAKLSQEPKLTGPTVIIGGGNVAIDAAMSAVRLGGAPVHLVCLESRDEMPAHEWEIRQAEEEGVEIRCSWGPQRFEPKDGQVAGVDFVKCTRVFDEQGRFSPQFDDSQTLRIEATAVVVTIGQEVAADGLASSDRVKRGPGGTLAVDGGYSLGLEGVFAAGDAVKGPSSVVEAMADGRRAAEKIDAYLGGSGIGETAVETTAADDPRLDAPSGAMQRERQTAPTAPLAERASGFTLIDRTFSEQAARAEADRCLRCHLRSMIQPVVLPPELWKPLTADEVAAVPQCEGVFQLLDADKKVIGITGTADLNKSLTEKLESPGSAVFFTFEEDPMFTKLESELIQQYLQKHGELPGGGVGGDDLDDLF